MSQHASSRSDRRTGRGAVATVAVVALAGLLALALSSPAEEPGASSADVVWPDDLPRTLDSLPFTLGETCTFELAYGPIVAGEATIAIEDTMQYFGQRVVHARTRARSNRFFDAFFKVRDQADSYIDADSLFARYFAKRLREGGFERDVELHFDQNAGIVYAPDGTADPIPPGTHDVLSAFFRVRSMDLVDGAVFDLPARGDRRFYELQVRVLRREERDTVLGRKRCVVVQPVLGDEGLFKHEGDLFVWLTDDERRIPVLMRATVPVGAIEARLKKYVPGRPW